MTSFETDDLHSIVANRDRFANYVYTPLAEALEIWRRRQGGRLAAQRPETAIGAKVPAILRGNKPVGILCRQLGTPNYETRRVIRLCAERDIRLVIWEYYADRFVMEIGRAHV